MKMPDNSKYFTRRSSWHVFLKPLCAQWFIQHLVHCIASSLLKKVLDWTILDNKNYHEIILRWTAIMISHLKNEKGIFSSSGVWTMVLETLKFLWFQKKIILRLFGSNEHPFLLFVITYCYRLYGIHFFCQLTTIPQPIFIPSYVFA